MYISARERSILTLIVKQNDGIPLSDIAKSLEVSTRTIQRDLKGIEDILAEFNLSLKKGINGFGVVGNLDDRVNLMSFLGTLDHEEYTPEERQVVLLSHLLHVREPVKLFALANELNVTVATVSNDLIKVEKWLSQFQLTLIKKRGYGVEVVGDEVIIRRALSKLISENLNEDYFYQILSGVEEEQTAISRVVLKRLMHYVDLDTVKKVKETIDKWRITVAEEMVDSSYVGLIVHVTLAIERLKQGERIELRGEYLHSLQTYKEFDLAKSLAGELEKVMGIQILDEEVGYISMHLRAVKWMNQKEEVLEGSDLQLAVTVKKFIDEVGKELNLFLEDDALYQGLVAHLKPAMYRMSQRMKIHNPLLEKIKDDYAELFHAVKMVAKRIFHSLDIPDEEIGFLVMHFGSVLEIRRKKAELKALVICSSGIGSSKLLASRLNKEFPEITMLKNASLFELGQLQLHDYDLVISTVPLQGIGHYFHVKPFLSKDEVQTIRNYLDNVLTEKAVVWKENVLQPKKGTLQSYNQHFFKVVGDINEDIQIVLQQFELKELKPDLLENNLAALCKSYQHKKIIQSSEDVLEALLEREKLGGLAIPGTSLALFHTRHQQINQPFFSIYQLQEPLLRRGMDNQSILVERILVLLAPETFTEHRLALLSYISALIIESEQSTHLFEQEKELEIKQFLANRFKEFLQETLQKEWTK
ncbi:BglG family transcription antiterminator [Alkalihalobacillus sp. 1P02AB]|uniref:BglG family transcription antiterminator n=1 Tax=Alkalihalobacillus sp. 1P02AB TaxID=3132260 RepID=UPI0039A76B1C